MILIESIKYYEVEGDWTRVMEMLSRDHIPCYGSEESVSAELAQTIVRGRRFVRPSDGTDVFIGNTPDVAKLIGLQYEAWDEREKTYRTHVDGLNNTIYSLGGALRKAETASWTTRLGWLFKGYRRDA